MKHIIIIGAFPEDISFIRGGVQASVYGIAKTLKTRKDVSTVKVISLPVKGSHALPAPRTVDGVEVLPLKAHRLLALSIMDLPLILHEISATPVPLVHIHGTGLIQLALLTVLRMKGVKCVWTLHGITAKETLQRYRTHKTIPALARHIFYRLIERFSITAAPHIIVDTPYVQHELRRTSRISVIPQGIFSEEFSGMHILARDLPVILSVGVIAPRKGHHCTIEAFARVHTKMPESRLIIAGSVSDASYHRQLKEQILRLHLSASIDLLTDIPRETIMQHFARARIFALHSEEESQGIALCEALAAGLPVVATTIGGIPFVVTDKKDGLLAGYKDIYGFSEAMLSLLEDTALYERMATAAQTSSSRFDWKNIADEVMNIYEKM